MRCRACRASFALAALAALVAIVTIAASARGAGDASGASAPEAPEIVLREALALPNVGRGRREPFPIDPVAARLVSGIWTPPAPGDVVPLADGTSATWERVSAGDDGVIRHDALRGGYVYWEVVAASESVMILDASGHDHVTVNGELRAGDPYSTGAVRLPVALAAGANQLLFRCSRGHLRATLRAGAAVFLNASDVTLPDLVTGEGWAVRGAIVVVNATPEPMTGLALRSGGSLLPVRTTRLPRLEALTARKVAFWLGGAVDPESRECPLEISILDGTGPDGVELDATTIALRVRRPDEQHKRTFESAIDGSVQYYAVVPANPSDRETHDPPALILTLHGASVEATAQAAAYEPKSWAHVVAPTNRRPFGFDWEEWGRLDAIEVLEEAQKRFHTDPDRTYLTGHSMGGHGTWHLGVTYPDRFAALGPSAGWVSFWSYGAAAREGATAVERMLERASSPSDTLRLARNALACSVYVLHGDADDNVPVEHARTMRERLEAIHPDFAYHEEPGAGHWWGNRCCDWPPMMEFFAIRARAYPDEVEELEFTTASPGISSRFYWLSIEQQIASLAPSTVTADVDRKAGRIVLTTENVERLALDLGLLAFERAQVDARAAEPVAARDVVTVSIDGEEIACAVPADRTAPLAFAREDAEPWSLSGPLPPGEKGPHRYGPFKEAFRNRVAFVYGTRGDDAENAWARAKARYDAETFGYRGNGSIDVMPDRVFDPESDRDRSIVLYGNAQTNGAWGPLLGAREVDGAAPITVTRALVRVGALSFEGDDLACLFVRPRPGSDSALVAAVSGTGPAGFRATERLPYFVSGVAYPDFIVFDATAPERGAAAVRCAGFFGSDWSLERGDLLEGGEPEPHEEEAADAAPDALPEALPVEAPEADDPD